MNNLVNTLFFLSILGSLLAAIVYMTNKFVRNMFYKSWQYYIWLIVILRFSIPIFPEIYYINENLEPASIINYGQPFENTNNELSFPAVQTTKPTNVQTENTTIQPVKYIINSIFNIFHLMLNNIGVLWFTGFILTFCLNLLLYLGFLKKVKKCNCTIDNENYIFVFERCKSELNIKQKINLLKNSYISSPVLIGIFKTNVLLPDRLYSIEELEYVFKHELTHYKQLDLFIKWFVNFTVSVHWFNPLIYLVRNEINKSCELSCDETVIRYLNKEQRKIYGNMLLKTAEIEALKNSKFVPAMLEDKKILKERLSLIMKFKTVSKKIAAVSVAMFLCISSLAVLCGATFISKPSSDLTKIPTMPTTSFKLNSNTNVFFLSKSITYASQYSNQEEFLINGNNDIQVLLDVQLQEGNYRFYIKSKSDKVVFEKTGNDKSERIQISDIYLEDGKYTTIFEGNNIKEVDYKFVGMSISPGSSRIVTPQIDNVKLNKEIVINGEACNIDLVQYEGESAKYEYNKDLFEVIMKINKDNQSEITAKGKAGTKTGIYDRIKIYIPNIDYDRITINLNESGMSIDEINASMDITSTKGSVAFSIPKNFTKNINYISEKGSGTINFVDGGPDNFEFNLNKGGSAVSMASKFIDYKPNETTYKYIQGNGTAKINVTVNDSALSIGTENSSQNQFATASGNTFNFNQQSKTPYFGGIASNLTRPLDSFKLNAGQTVSFNLEDELTAWGLKQSDLYFEITLKDENNNTKSIKISNKEPNQSITIDKNGTYSVSMHNPNMQLLNYNFSIIY